MVRHLSVGADRERAGFCNGQDGGGIASRDRRARRDGGRGERGPAAGEAAARRRAGRRVDPDTAGLCRRSARPPNGPARTRVHGGKFGSGRKGGRSRVRAAVRRRRRRGFIRRSRGDAVQGGTPTGRRGSERGVENVPATSGSVSGVGRGAKRGAGLSRQLEAMSRPAAVKAAE